MPTSKTGERLSMVAVLCAAAFMVLVLIGFAYLIIGSPGFAPVPPGEIQMGLVVVFAIGGLLVLLTAMAYVFQRQGLADPKQALGLPEGSIRALIALFLIMIFIIMSVYLFRTISPTVGVSDAAQKLALQMVTILGTLVTAVSAFYFGSQTARPLADAAETAPKVVALSVDTIAPPSAQASAGEVKTEIIGTGFAAGAQVKFRLGSVDLDATETTVVDGSKIRCTFDLTKCKTDKWDVVVKHPDGRQAGKSGIFQIT